MGFGVPLWDVECHWGVDFCFGGIVEWSDECHCGGEVPMWGVKSANSGEECQCWGRLPTL